MPAPSPPSPPSPPSAAKGAKAAKAAKRGYSEPGRYGVTFNPAKGTLTFFRPEGLRCYRAVVPQAWLRDAWHPTWLGFRGNDDFEIADLIDAQTKLRERKAKDLSAGRPVRKWPGLRAKADFLAALDPESVALTAPIKSGSWELYCALCRSPALRDVAKDNPALAMLIGQSHRFDANRFRAIGRLAKHKRMKIAARLKMPEARDVVRIFAKVPRAECTPFLVNQLCEIVRHVPAARLALRHVPSLDLSVVLASRHAPAVVTPALLMRLVEAIDTDEALSERVASSLFHSYQGLVMHSLYLADDLGIRRPRFTEIEQIRTWHDQAAVRLARRPAAPREEAEGPAFVARIRAAPRFADDTVFAAPPIPPTQGIIPLRTPAELQQEAAVQRNCLALSHYAEAVLAGKLFVYRVLEPERGSLAIRKCGDVWLVDELKAYCNEPVAPHTFAAVHEWLRGAQPGKSVVPRRNVWSDDAIPF